MHTFQVNKTSDQSRRAKNSNFNNNNNKRSPQVKNPVKMFKTDQPIVPDIAALRKYRGESGGSTAATNSNESQTTTATTTPQSSPQPQASSPISKKMVGVSISSTEVVVVQLDKEKESSVGQMNRGGLGRLGGTSSTPIDTNPPVTIELDEIKEDDDEDDELGEEEEEKKPLSKNETC